MQADCPSCGSRLTPLGVTSSGPQGERLDRHTCPRGCGQFDVARVKQTEHQCPACGHAYVEERVVRGGTSQLPGMAARETVRSDQLGFPPLR